MDIIFAKVLRHNNLNLTKYASRTVFRLHSLPCAFPYRASNLPLQLPSFFYGRLFQLINIGVIYSESPLHKDSPLSQ